MVNKNKNKKAEGFVIALYFGKAPNLRLYTNLESDWQMTANQNG